MTVASSLARQHLSKLFSSYGMLFSSHHTIFTHKSLLIRYQYRFSIKNYMKTYASEQVTRHHGRMRVDENLGVFESKQKIDEFLEGERSHYDRWEKQWASRTQRYVSKANERQTLQIESTPEIIGDYEYFTRVAWHEGREYTQIFRTSLQDKQSKKEQLVLDIMKHASLRKYHKTIELTKVVFSPCHRYIALGVDLHNNEETCFMIHSIERNSIVGIEGWENNRLLGVDNMVFYYEGDGKKRGGKLAIFFTRLDRNLRPWELWFQGLEGYLTNPQDKHQQPMLKIYEQKNQELYLDITMSKNQSHLIVSANGKANNRVWLVDPKTVIKHRIMREVRVVNDNTSDKLYVNHCGKYFVTWRNCLQGDEIYVSEYSLPANSLSHKKGKDQSLAFQLIHKTEENESITDIDVFSTHIVLYMKKIVSPIVRVIPLPAQITETPLPYHNIILPYAIGSVHPGANTLLSPHSCLIYFNNLFVYNEGYELSLSTLQLTLVEKFEMTGKKFKAEDYIVKVHEVPAMDGESVPMTTVVPRKQRGFKNKMLVHVYGFYGLPYDVGFNMPYVVALEEGWSLAYAHVRGGSEKGRKWHTQAIRNRNKTFEDLEDCIAYLLSHEYTHPSILFLSSHSAGAITIFAAISRKPHLYKGCIMSYPFLDVLTMMLEKDKPLVQSDYAEFGNPLLDLKAYNQIESYAPYEAIRPGIDYPFIFIIGGGNDYRCPVSQIAKFVNRFRRVKSIPSSKKDSSIIRDRFQNIERLSKENTKTMLSQQNAERQRYDMCDQGLLVKINEEASHEGLPDLHEQIRAGCEILAVMDCLIEEFSSDVDSGVEIKYVMKEDDGSVIKEDRI